MSSNQNHPNRHALLTHTALAALLIAICCLPALAGEEGKTVSIVDHGAVGDGKMLCTAAIQKAVDACAAAGGGIVRVPKGTFLTGSIRLASQVTVLLEEGAVLLGSSRIEDYFPGEPPAPAGQLPPRSAFRNLLDGRDLHDVAIRGRGTIDGSGGAHRDKTKPRPKNFYFENCTDVCVEGLTLRASGSWMLHCRLSRNVTLKDLDVFNHVSFNNDGLDIDSCRDVALTNCRVDTDDDAIVLKSLSDQPCRNVRVSGCTISSHCNALKMGTESGGGFLDVEITGCTVRSPARSKVIYGKQRGLAGVALEIVDGGTLDNVRVSKIDIEGVSVPIFLRLGNRARQYGRKDKPPVGTFRNVRISDITARSVSPIGCSITGLPGHPIQDVTMSNVKLEFEGGGTAEDAARKISERETAYPESTMFGALPAWGFYCRHVRGLKFHNLRLSTSQADLRPAMVFDDAREIEIDHLDAPFAANAAPLLRLIAARDATLRNLSSRDAVDTLLCLEGKETARIVLGDCEAKSVRQLISKGADVPEGALTHRAKQ